MIANILEILDRWVAARREPLAVRGIKVSVTFGSADRIPQAAWADFESATRAARLTLWADGQANLGVLDFEKDEELIDEHREITDTIGFDGVEQTILSWLG
ncbi:MAG: hypothetical protein M3Z75_12010 [Actinomycetota bacterium]|nr:hypothetical protein [Actinomycetota bacterium]